MKKIFRASLIAIALILCISLAACKKEPAEQPAESPSASPVTSPTLSPAPTASPEITTPDEALTGTASDLVGRWQGTNESPGSNLDFESTALVSVTIFDIEEGEIITYSGAAVVEDGTITIADRTLGEDIALPYSIAGKIVTITHNGLVLTLEKQ